MGGRAENKIVAGNEEHGDREVVEGGADQRRRLPQQLVEPEERCRASADLGDELLAAGALTEVPGQLVERVEELQSDNPPAEDGDASHAGDCHDGKFRLEDAADEEASEEEPDAQCYGGRPVPPPSRCQEDRRSHDAGGREHGGCQPQPRNPVEHQSPGTHPGAEDQAARDEEWPQREHCGDHGARCRNRPPPPQAHVPGAEQEEEWRHQGEKKGRQLEEHLRVAGLEAEGKPQEQRADNEARVHRREEDEVPVERLFKPGTAYDQHQSRGQRQGEGQAGNVQCEEKRHG